MDQPFWLNQDGEKHKIKTFIFWHSSWSRPWTKLYYKHTLLSGVYAVSAKAAICIESSEEPTPTLAEPTKAELTNLEEKELP